MAAGAALVGVLLGGLLTALSGVELSSPSGSAAALPPAVSAAAAPAAPSGIPSGIQVPAAPVPVPATPAPAAAALPLPSSPPTRLRVPSIGVDVGGLSPLGLQADRTIEVPPGSRPREAGWFEYGATPGSPGPAVILGHVNGGGEDGVFADLDRTAVGDRITVTRVDGKNAEFTVTAVRLFPKSDFPTRTVYGDTPDAQLRLITCGGTLDRAAHNYLSNVVVFAELTGVTDA